MKFLILLMMSTGGDKNKGHEKYTLYACIGNEHRDGRDGAVYGAALF